MKKSLIALVALALSSTSALAHASLEVQQAAQNSTYKAVMRIAHGCQGETTLKVRIQIPEGVIAVKPMPKANWSLETVTGAYESEYEYYGSTLTEGVKEIVWTGELLDHHFDEFIFRGKLTDKLAAGSTVYFPTIQECANGTNRWIEIPAEGQDPHELDGPAPGLEILKPGHSH